MVKRYTFKDLVYTTLLGDETFVRASDYDAINIALLASGEGYEKAQAALAKACIRIRELEADLHGWLQWYWENANGRSAATRRLLFPNMTNDSDAQLAARKLEPEHQAQMKWARDVVSNVVIPPAGSTDSGGDVK